MAMSPLEKGRINKVSDVLTSEAKAEIHGDGSRHQSVAGAFFFTICACRQIVRSRAQKRVSVRCNAREGGISLRI